MSDHTHQAGSTTIPQEQEPAEHWQTNDVEALLTCLDDIVFELSEQRIFKQVWCKDESLLYLPKDQIIGRHMNDVLGPQSEMFAALIDALLATGVSQEIEYEDQRPEVDNWYRLRVNLIKGGAPGSGRRIMAVIKDITQYKLTHLELIYAKEQAEKAARERGEFLSVMSHEIRTPLNGIIGIANLLEETPQHGNLVRSLKYSADHLLTLINDILDLSKIEAGKVELESVPFDLKRLLRDIENNYQPLAQSKKVRLHTVIDPFLPHSLCGDPFRLTQILNNLINNAIKFTHEGSIFIEVKLLSQTAANATVSFCVKDTGIGIQKDMQRRIFESFVQAQSDTTRQHGGTGLGLAITKSLVELYNSSIAIDSEPGLGTTFRFDIVFDQLPAVTRTNITYNEKQLWDWLKNKKLLVVEDNTINAMVIVYQLQRTGAATLTAVNGREAVEMMQQQHFDGVLLDLHMPEMDGYDTIPHIRRLQPHAFIIALTADVIPNVADKLNSLQVHSILHKPYDPTTLYRTLANLAGL